MNNDTTHTAMFRMHGRYPVMQVAIEPRYPDVVPDVEFTSVADVMLQHEVLDVVEWRHTDAPGLRVFLAGPDHLDRWYYLVEADTFMGVDDTPIWVLHTACDPEWAVRAARWVLAAKLATHA